MSTSAAVGEIINFNNKRALVVRVVDSSTLFQDASTEGQEDCYILVEKYAELRVEGSNEPAFLVFNSSRHETTTPELLKGLDPKVWKRCP